MAPPTRVGRYEIHERLGEGGMGAVYRGTDPNIGRQIAVKVLHGHLSDSTVRQRFVQEARSAGSLTHPNIVTVHDFGEVDGAPYLVMEYIRGWSLAKVIKRRDTVPLATKVEWLIGLCAGLHHAHECRIIHRDVKPQNLIVDERGTLKILDFGIARVAESSLTAMSGVVGTPGYMSPEQIESRAIDRRSDIFSAGAVAYALLSYRDAFAGDTAAAVLHRVLTESPPPLAEVCKGLAPAIVAVVERALRKAPDERFATASDMQRALMAALRELPAEGPEPATAVHPPPTARDVGTPQAGTPAEFRRRRFERLQRHLRDARDGLSRGDTAAALRSVEDALTLDPDHPEAQRLLVLADEARADALEPGSRTPIRLPAPWRSPAEALHIDTPPDSGGPASLLGAGAEAEAVPRECDVLAESPISPVGPDPTGLPMGRTGARPYRPAILAALTITVLVVALWVLASPTPVMSPHPVEENRQEDSLKAADTREPIPDAQPGAVETAEAVTRAVAAERAQNWTAARQGYEAVLALVPDHADARAGLARVEARLAVPPPKKGPSVEDRVRADGLVRRATSKYDAGDYDGAAGDLTEALRFVPGHEGAAALLTSVRRAKETEALMSRRPRPGAPQ